MRFYAPPDTVICLALTNGHTAVVTADGVELPEMFWAEAKARGALTGSGAEPADGTEVLRGVLLQMMADAQPADFTKDGRPDLRKVRQRLDFEVTRAEVDEAWAALELA